MMLDSRQGGLFGIGIALTFMIVFNRIPLDPMTLLSNIVVGFGLGFIITLGNRVVFMMFGLIYSKFYKLIWLQMLVSYFVNVLLFYVGVTLVNLVFYLEIFKQNFIFNLSLGVGIGSSMVTLFFIYKREKEEKLRLEKENKELAVITERNRIARDLHDSVSQNLFGISLNLNTIQYLLEQNPLKAKKMLNLVREMIEETQTEMRLMIYELMPAALTEKKLFEAVEGCLSLFRVRYGLKINYQIHGKDELLDSQKQIILYRVLQESLNNIVKHAKATLVKVNLEISAGCGELMIEDNGQGFEYRKDIRQNHLGISGMEERINQLHGEFKIITGNGKGTIVRARV